LYLFLPFQASPPHLPTRVRRRFTGDKKELKPDEVVANPDIEFPFSDEDLLARQKTPAEALKAYREAYAPKAGSPALDAGDPADKDDPEVQDGKPDIGAIEYRKK